MIRIFGSLAVTALLLLLISLFLGLMVGDLNYAVRELAPLNERIMALQRKFPPPKEEIKQLREELRAASERQLRPVEQSAFYHVMCGIVSTLVALLVYCVAVTYFIGTSRWCREVADAYDLGDELPQRSAQLKRRSFPWSVGGFFLLLGNACLGMLTYRDAGLHAEYAWANWHFLSALSITALTALGYYTQWNFLAANGQVIDDILARVKAIRAARGLPVE